MTSRNAQKHATLRKEILSYVSRNQSTNYNQGSTQRNLSHFKLIKSVEEESDYEDQSVETNHMGNELEREECETTPRRSKRDQRPVKRYGIYGALRTDIIRKTMYSKIDVVFCYFKKNKREVM